MTDIGSVIVHPFLYLAAILFVVAAARNSLRWLAAGLALFAIFFILHAPDLLRV